MIGHFPKTVRNHCRDAGDQLVQRSALRSKFWGGGGQNGGGIVSFSIDPLREVAEERIIDEGFQPV